VFEAGFRDVVIEQDLQDEARSLVSKVSDRTLKRRYMCRMTYRRYLGVCRRFCRIFEVFDEESVEKGREEKMRQALKGASHVNSQKRKERSEAGEENEETTGAYDVTARIWDP
jgi:hypothetical protein